MEHCTLETGGYRGVGIEENNSSDFYIRQYNSLPYLVVQVGNTPTQTVSFEAANKIHLGIEYSPIEPVVNVYRNGVLTNTVTPVFDTSVSTGRTFMLGAVHRYGADKINNMEHTLFNIHTTPQDPLELYNNAVKKGLLQ